MKRYYTQVEQDWLADVLLRIMKATADKRMIKPKRKRKNNRRYAAQQLGKEKK